VFFPEKAPWLEDLENELLAFPGRHDDQVDALIQGLAWRREGFGFLQCGRTVGWY
jgi:phage terminase large subunit-like protein